MYPSAPHSNTVPLHTLKLYPSAHTLRLYPSSTVHTLRLYPSAPRSKTVPFSSTLKDCVVCTLQLYTLRLCSVYPSALHSETVYPSLVRVVNDNNADMRNSRISSRKQKRSQNCFNLFTWGPGKVFFCKKGVKGVQFYTLNTCVCCLYHSRVYRHEPKDTPKCFKIMQTTNS